MMRPPHVLAAEQPPNNPWGDTPETKSQPKLRTVRPQPRHVPPRLGSDMPIERWVMLGAGLAALLWLGSGLYRVQPQENAVLLHFGRYTQTVTEPGLHYHWPWPVEQVLKPNVTFERRIEMGYGEGDFYSGQDAKEASMMLTGDANIVDLHFVVQWKIGDAKQFLFNIRDPQGTLKRVAESAMREVVGQNNLQDIITDKREDIAARVKTIMQDILNSYGSGVMITQVLIQDATVPAPVLDAFEDVVRANQQAETLKNQALRYRNEIVPRAQGDAIRLVKEAEAYQSEVVARAKGDAQRFSEVYAAYQTAPEVTRKRLYLDTMEEMLKNTRPIIMEGGAKGALPYLNLNELRNKATDKNAGEIAQ